ncbi:MAG: hypothetical protein WCI67_17885 [Chloroflexales bacterium]
MTVLYRIAPDIHVLYYAGFGHCTGQELFIAELAARQAPLREPAMLIIIDILAVTELDIDVANFRQGVEMNRQRLAQGEALEPTAFIIRKAIDQSVADTYAMFAELAVSLRMAAFYSLSPALDWLGLSQHKGTIMDIRQALHAQYAREHGRR